MQSKAFLYHYSDIKKLNPEIVGISRDSIKSHCNFIEKQDLNFPLISDEDESICKLFDVLKEKSMFGKKYFGIARSTFLIDANGVLRHEWRDVSVVGHVKEVMNCVRDL